MHSATTEEKQTALSILAKLTIDYMRRTDAGYAEAYEQAQQWLAENYPNMLRALAAERL